MKKIKINNNSTPKQLITSFVDYCSGYTLKKLIKYNKTYILDDIFTNHMNDDKRTSDFYYDLWYDFKGRKNDDEDYDDEFKYIYKYAYYHKNVNIIIDIARIILDEGGVYGPDDLVHAEMIRGFFHYLKRKKTSFYNTCANYYINYEYLNVTHLSKDYNDIFDLVRVNYKYNYKNFLYSMYDTLDLSKYNDNTAKYEIFIDIYVYFKKYDENQIKKIDFNLIIDLLNKKILDVYTYSIVGIFAILYCLENKNSNILCIFAEYMNKMFGSSSKMPNIQSYFIFYIISYLANYEHITAKESYAFNIATGNEDDVNDEYDVNDEDDINDNDRDYKKYEYNILTKFKKLNNNDFKRLTTKQFLNPIKKIIGNDLYYKNALTKTNYITINKIINIENPSEIDKIIIENIYNSNITNTIEYKNAINTN